MTRPSKLGVCLAALAVMMYWAAIQSRSGLLFLVLGLLCACFALNLWQAWRTVASVRLTPPPALVGVEGVPLDGVWSARNVSHRPATAFDVRCAWGDLLRVAHVPAHGCVHVTPHLALPRRGIYAFSELRVVCSAPFGLIRTARRLRVPGHIVVHPEAYPCPAPPAAGFEPVIGGTFKGLNRSSVGEHFHGVRPMQPSDPVKFIHWPSSAKGQGYMVREYDEELAGRVGIVVDPRIAGETAEDAGVDWTARADGAARAVASLMFAALEHGHQVEYIDVLEGMPLSIPPFSDGTPVLDSLARLSVHRTAPSAAGFLAAVMRLPRKASLCLVPLQPTTDFAGAVSALVDGGHRRLAVYLPAHATAMSYPSGVAVQRYAEHGFVE